MNQPFARVLDTLCGHGYGLKGVLEAAWGGTSVLFAIKKRILGDSAPFP